MVADLNRKISIIISGYYGFDNCGDEAILLTMIHDFSKFISRKKIVVLSANPQKTRNLYQVDAINRLNPFAIILKMTQASVFISGGGGLLQDVSGKGYSILYYLSLIFLAHLFNIPSIIYAQGIGPIRQKFNKRLISWIFKTINLIIVRDEPSGNLLKELGIEGSMIEVNADPSFLLKKAEIPETINKKYRFNKISKSDNIKNTKNIGIVLRKCKKFKENKKNITEDFAKIADYLIDKYQANIFFIPFQVDADLDFMKKIQKKMKSSSAICIEEEFRPDQMLSLFEKMDLVIGMRFHSIVFAALEEKPFIAIEYDPKVRYLVNSLDISEMLINIDQLTVKTIDNKLQYINVNKEKFKSKLRQNKKIFENKAHLNVQMFRRFIKKLNKRKGDKKEN